MDEATLLKEWDIARFFPDKLKSKNQSPNNSDNLIKKREKEKIQSHRRVESDAKVSNPLFRGFRRENSDFFPLSSRHSAIFDRNVNIRSSGIFNNRRGSDVNITLNNHTNGEPVLTEFVKRNTDNNSNNALKNIGFLRDPKLDFLRPRREKTESDIIIKNNANRSVRDNLQARRLEVENKFAKQVEEFRKRSSRPLDISNEQTNKSEQGEYMYLQVKL